MGKGMREFQVMSAGRASGEKVRMRPSCECQEEMMVFCGVAETDLTAFSIESGSGVLRERKKGARAASST